MGSNRDKDPEAFPNETPQFWLPVETFQIGAYPVTVAEYACYIDTNPTIQPPPSYTFPDSEWVAEDWRMRALTWEMQQQRPDYPVVLVSWSNAHDYATWLTRMTGQIWRLPTEVEWEKTARGTDGRIYPWGDQWDKQRANCGYDYESPMMMTPIGTYALAGDASPYGCHDLVGNVWEWCSSIHRNYPYETAQSAMHADPSAKHVIRGGSWYVGSRFTRAAARLDFWDFVNDDRGFRVVCVSAPSSGFFPL